jgi:hypothetical protein
MVAGGGRGFSFVLFSLQFELMSKLRGFRSHPRGPVFSMTHFAFSHDVTSINSHKTPVG